MATKTSAKTNSTSLYLRWVAVGFVNTLKKCRINPISSLFIYSRFLPDSNVFVLLFFTISFQSCKKELLIRPQGGESVLKNSGGISNVKKQFLEGNYQSKLTEKLKDTTSVIWHPNWNKTTEKTVGDSITYIYIPLDGELYNTRIQKFTGALNTINVEKYLLYTLKKDSSSFSFASYILKTPLKKNSKGILSAVGKKYINHTLRFQSFNGRLVLKDLKHGNVSVINYINGKHYFQPLKKLQSNSSGVKTLGYEEQNCRYYVTCTWVTEFSPVCSGGGSYYGMSSGDEWCYELDNTIGGCYFYWDLVSSIISKECDYVYVPDPPPPGDVGNNQDPETDYLSQREAEISDSLSKKDNFLLNCDSLTLLQLAAYRSYGSMYQQVAQFSPSQAIKDRIDYLRTQESFFDIDNFYYQNLDQAFGPVVNSDFFPVRITNMPPGTTPANLLENFRLNMNSFISSSNGTSFTPYADAYVDDASLFNKPGAQSVGAYVHINLLNDGTVVESDYQSNANESYFTFSTIGSPLDGAHPVAGNRRFGVYADPARPGEFTFYTMGIDRTSDLLMATGNAAGWGFDSADALWNDIQKNMINNINSKGGHADYYNKKSYIARPDYETVKDYLKGNITLLELKQKIGC